MLFRYLKSSASLWESRSAAQLLPRRGAASCGLRAQRGAERLPLTELADSVKNKY